MASPDRPIFHPTNPDHNIRILTELAREANEPPVTYMARVFEAKLRSSGAFDWMAAITREDELGRPKLDIYVGEKPNPDGNPAIEDASQDAYALFDSLAISMEKAGGYPKANIFTLDTALSSTTALDTLKNWAQTEYKVELVYEADFTTPQP